MQSNLNYEIKLLKEEKKKKEDLEERIKLRIEKLEKIRKRD